MMDPRPVGLGLTAVCLLLLAGCGTLGRREAGAAYAPQEPEMERMADVAQEQTARDGTLPPPSPLSAVTREEDAEPAPAAPQQGRLRVYTGYLELLVAEPERARGAVIQTAGQLGGYVESTTTEYVVVRVPAARLEEAMDIIARLGEVRSRSVETSDVTEGYADLGRRIEVARRTRDRLYTLLERTTDVEERVEILREIRRLTEEVERLTAALSVMEGQILLSRLTVLLRSRIDEASGAGRGAPFAWIARLSPLQPATRAAAAVVPVVPPEDYAVFEAGRRVRLEAADGTRVSIGAVGNQPQGDTTFWREALVFHLGELYRKGDPVVAGSFEGAVFESKDIVPFHYMVAVHAQGAEILVAEAFFPDGEARERRLGAILGMLEGWKP